MYYTEDAIEQVKKMRKVLAECKKLCEEDKSSTPLQKKTIDLLSLIEESVEDILMNEYRFYDNDID